MFVCGLVYACLLVLVCDCFVFGLCPCRAVLCLYCVDVVSVCLLCVRLCVVRLLVFVRVCVAFAVCLCRLCDVFELRLCCACVCLRLCVLALCLDD